MNNIELEQFINQILKPEKIRDYCPNGLQIHGQSQVKKIVSGVTATQALIDAAIEKQADSILVHHGFFWKGESSILKGMKRSRIKALLNHDINLYAYHLPLDIHPELGNNAQLGKLLGITNITGLEAGNPTSVAVRGELEQAKSLTDISLLIEQKLKRKPMVEVGGDFGVKTIAWCTGGGQSYIELAAEQGIDLFITGEVSEQTIHVAREMGIHFIAAGHHATERYGAKALGEYIAAHTQIEVEFVDIDNPA